MHSRLCTGLSLISNPTLQAAHGCNLDFVPAPLWPHLMNSPHTLSYLSTHFFRSCQWNYSCRTHPSTALQHGLKGQWVELPWGQKSPVLKCFVGLRQQLHISNLSRCTGTPSSALQTRPALLPWNATLTLLLRQYCSNPVTAHLRDHEMSNSGCGTVEHSHGITHWLAVPSRLWNGALLGTHENKAPSILPWGWLFLPRRTYRQLCSTRLLSWAVLCVCWMHKVSAREVSSD